MAGNATKIIRLPRTYEVQDSVTRPANATQYGAGDTISDVATTATAAGAFTLDFKTQAQGYGSVRFIDFTLHKSDHDVTAATFWLLLFTTLPALANFGDNDACQITDAEMLECKGTVTFAAANWQNVVTGDIQTVSQDIGVVFGSAQTTVYGILIAGDTYTPASGEIFTLTAHAWQD